MGKTPESPESQFPFAHKLAHLPLERPKAARIELDEVEQPIPVMEYEQRLHFITIVESIMSHGRVHVRKLFNRQ